MTLPYLALRPGAPSSLVRYQAMQFRPTALERAFELAKSGDYETVSDIRKKLNSEGYSADQVSGRTLQRQLRELIEAAR